MTQTRGAGCPVASAVDVLTDIFKHPISGLPEPRRRLRQSHSARVIASSHSSPPLFPSASVMKRSLNASLSRITGQRLGRPHADRPITLSSELRRILGILAAPGVETPVGPAVAFDPSKAQSDAPVLVAPAEATAVSPCAVKMVVVRPDQLPVAAADRMTLVSGPIERKAGDDGARGICARAAGVRVEGQWQRLGLRDERGGCQYRGEKRWQMLRNPSHSALRYRTASPANGALNCCGPPGDSTRPSPALAPFAGLNHSNRYVPAFRSTKNAFPASGW